MKVEPACGEARSSLLALCESRTTAPDILRRLATVSVSPAQHVHVLRAPHAHRALKSWAKVVVSMDVFKLEQGLGLGQTARAPSPDVSFDAGSEFNLSFFDPPEDSVGFSDPGSVGSTTPASPPVARPLQVPPSALPAQLIKQEPQQYALADSSAAASSKTFVPCKVCGDKASGYHYGVTSCEGCKGFFRRSIQKMIEYRCLRDGKCLVIRLNRNRCQFCRFKKCLAVGMSRDSVRYGRVPKRSRERINEQAAHCSTTAELVEDSEPTSSTLELIRNVTAAHRAHCSINDDFDESDRKDEAVQFELVLAAYPDSLDAPDSPEKHRLWLWQHLAARVTPAVQRVVEFAKRVPGFSDFSQDDQLILIKMGFFEVWLTHTARQSAEGTLTFDDGSYFTHPQLEAMYDSQFATGVLHFMSGIGSLALTEPEIGIFSAAVLVTGERSGVMDPKGKQVHHDRLVEAFQIQIAHKGYGTTATSLLRELRVIGLRHAEHLEWPRTNWRGLRLPPLFAEIFDIPKIDVD